MKRWTDFMWNPDSWHDPSNGEAIFCGILTVIIVIGLLVLA